MPSNGLHILTNSRMQCWKTCPKKHHVLYDLGIRKIVSAQPLRMGSAVHEALDAHAQAKMNGLDDAECMNVGRGAIDDEYFNVPEWADEREWHGEREICRALFIGYVWRWSQDPIEYVATEQSFELPIVNPRTGRESTIYRRAGKIDKIAKWHGLTVVMEHKTTGDSIAEDSDYWGRLAVDTQISGYFIAAISLGNDIQTVLYDVIHKPGMRPLDQVPCLDGDGKKIVVHKETGNRMFKANGDPYLTAGREEHTYQYRQESIEEYGERLLKDIYDNPDKYYARKEIPRLECDLEEYKQELWSIQQSMRTAERNGWHFRNTDSCTKPYPCELKDLCWQGWDFENEVPTGFEKVTNIHPELKGETNAHDTAATAT